MKAAFEKFLTKHGVDVQVTTRTPQLDTDGITELTDTDGQPIYDEELNILKCRLNVLKGNEKVIEGLILKPGDAVGLFSLDDTDYLNTDSYVYIEYYGSSSFNFRILEIIPKVTHLQVMLQRVD